MYTSFSNKMQGLPDRSFGQVGGVIFAADAPRGPQGARSLVDCAFSETSSGAVYSIDMQVRVRVTPNGRSEKFEAAKDGAYAATVRERAERNEANHRVQQLVARHFNVPLTNVRFLTGLRSRKKIFEVVEL
jgi:uncharacterized protein YggU (UPF0235/DUF167 family)